MAHSCRASSRPAGRCSIAAFSASKLSAGGGPYGDSRGSTCATPDTMSPVAASAK
jgi:hypothetical protein